MHDRAAERRARFCGALCGLVLALAAGRCLAQEARIQWQTGFPLRAGPQVLLMWQPAPGAERYEVVRRDLATGREAKWSTTATQYFDTEAAPDQTYEYMIRAVLPGGVGLRSEAKKVAGVRALPAPVGLSGFQEGKFIRLVWNAVDGAAFYNVYRSAGSELATLAASVQEPRFVDAAVKSGISYTYRIRAVGPDSRESQESAPFSTAAPLAEGAGGRQETVDRRFLDVVRTIREGRQYRLREPTDLVFSAGALFVTNLGSRSILALDKEGQFLYQFGMNPPTYAGAWGIPWGLAVTADGTRLAATFLRSSNVRIFSRDGKLLADIPVARPKGYEERPEVPQPMDVAFDERQDLWVTDYTYAQIVHLSRDGRELGRVGNPRYAKDAGPFRTPTFIATDLASGNLYVADSLRGALIGLNPDGLASWIWERKEAVEGSTYLPKGLCVTKGGQVLVVDGLSSSLQSFSPGGKIEAVYYSRDKGFLDLRGVVSAAVDPVAGEIYALSKLDGAIYALRAVDGSPRK